MGLDIGDFPGVGKASKEKMHEHKIYNGQDLYNQSERELIRLLENAVMDCTIRQEV